MTAKPKNPPIPDRRRQHYPARRPLSRETIAAGLEGVRAARKALDDLLSAPDDAEAK